MLCHLHLVSPFVAPPPHVSILDPPPSFAPASCCISSHCTASAPCPLVNTAPSQCATASRHARNSTSHLPLVCPDWLPHCLLWHLRLTSSSLPSPSASASCCVLFSSSLASCHVVSHQPVPLQPPPSITSPVDGWLLCLPPAPLSATHFCLLPHPRASCRHQRCKCIGLGEFSTSASLLIKCFRSFCCFSSFGASYWQCKTRIVKAIMKVFVECRSRSHERTSSTSYPTLPSLEEELSSRLTILQGGSSKQCRPSTP